MDFEPVFAFLMTLAPWVSYVLMGLGTVVIVGTAVDKMIPDEKDHGFMTKVLALPVIGAFLGALARFSPFNIKQ